MCLGVVGGRAYPAERLLCSFMSWIVVSLVPLVVFERELCASIFHLRLAAEPRGRSMHGGSMVSVCGRYPACRERHF